MTALSRAAATQVIPRAIKAGMDAGARIGTAIWPGMGGSGKGTRFLPA